MRRRCGTCKGSGDVEVSDSVVVQLPPGIDDGAILRVPGRGIGAPGGRPGDLLVVVRSRPHPVFSRSGSDLRRRVRVEVADAVLGTSLRIPTLEETIDVEVPPGTQPGTALRVRGHGLPTLGSARRGDLFVTVDVHVPERLTSTEREAFEAMRRPR